MVPVLTMSFAGNRVRSWYSVFWKFANSLKRVNRSRVLPEEAPSVPNHTATPLFSMAGTGATPRPPLVLEPMQWATPTWCSAKRSMSLSVM